MSRVRSRLQRLERQQPKEAGATAIFWQNLCAKRPEDIIPDGNDWSGLFREPVPQPCPIELAIEQAQRGNFITLEQAKAMIASGEIVSPTAEIPPGC